MTIWIVEFWIHAQSQCQQIFKLGRSTSDEIGANSVTELHCIKFWPGCCTFEGAIWYSRSRHLDDPTNFCIEGLCLLRVWIVPCPDKLSAKRLWICQITKTFHSGGIFSSDSSWPLNARCTLQLIESMSNEQRIVKSAIIIQHKMVPDSLSCQVKGWHLETGCVLRRR